MAENTTPTKRVLPARERRESAAKRQASMSISTSSPKVQTNVNTSTSTAPSTTATTSTPNTVPTTTSQPTTDPPTQTESPAPTTEPPRQKRKYTKRAHLLKQQPESGTQTPSVYEDAVPAILASFKFLPTTTQKPSDAYSLQEYQSIAESAVLAASLYKSRVQWLCDGIFKRYWTKPVKRKGAVDAPADNPDPKSMHKLGGGTLVIEPHTFDVVFFTVKETQLIQPTTYRHPNQHTPKPTYPPHPPYGPVYVPPAGAPTLPSPSVTVKTPATPKPSAPPPSQTTPQAAVAPSGLSVKSETSSPNTKPSNLPPAPPRPPPSPSRGGTSDPVIQMLASRAAADPALKELMKVVATSRATPEQLKEFQGHIDEFNAVVKRQEVGRAKKEKENGREAAEIQSTPSAPPPPPTVASITPQAAALPVQPPSLVAAHPATYKAPVVAPQRPPSNVPAVPLAPPTYLPYPSPQMVPLPPPPPRQETVVKHVVMEFTSSATSTQSASQDRWLFPEHAVLDLRFGPLEMVCSFFVERKGSELLAVQSDKPDEEAGTEVTQWVADKDYYQPVTMTVKATHHRVIETIARSAKSLPAVQEYMKGVLKNKTRAPQQYLMYQLPREKPDGDVDRSTAEFVDSGVEISNDEDDELKDFYGID